MINPSVSPSDKPEVPVHLPALGLPAGAPAAPSNQPLMKQDIGSHASLLGYDWTKRRDQHAYSRQTGLPEVHAAVLNQDWTLAADLLCVEDLGLQWHPPVSQRGQMGASLAPNTSDWPAELPSTREYKQQRSILAMVQRLYDSTFVADAGCLYGANLLTLCLQLPAPEAFTKQVLDLAKKQAPQLLDLPDGSGRTPLYVVVQKNDANRLCQLLEAGANPTQRCRFFSGESPSAFEFARDKGSDEIFTTLLP